MRLAVFDIDGTLTLGEGLGTRCFFDALEAVVGRVGADRRLHSYAESTDCGIAREAARRLLGRAPLADETEAFKAEYFSRLEAAIGADRGAYRPVPGAAGVMPMLLARGDWQVAVATGNWRRSATMKLVCAGIEAPAALACSEDGEGRARVLAAAVAAAAAGSGVEAFEAVVYVGDQPWDLRAAEEAGAGFVGVAAGRRASRLQGAGVAVVDGYEDAAVVLAAVDEAAGAAALRLRRARP